jgi:hypothetical protein
MRIGADRAWSIVLGGTVIFNRLQSKAVAFGDR